MHVQNTVSKCNRLLGFIRSVAGHSSLEALLQLYKSLVLPVLDYCTPIWNPYLQKNIAAVEKIQRTATRMILKQRRQDEPYESRLARLN